MGGRRLSTRGSAASHLRAYVRAGSQIMNDCLLKPLLTY
jgi:hypothetical protein